MDGLSERGVDKITTTVYRFLRNYILRHGYAPTELEMVAEFPESSRRAIRKSIQKLAATGKITLIPNRKRNILLANMVECLKSLPILGMISAGKPIQPLETDQVLNLTDLLLGPKRFVLEVVGDSMSGDNICDGDYIICERRMTAKDGEIVVVLINNQETTLKRLQHNVDGSLTLLPSNPEVEPMHYQAEEITIQGVYLGLIRLTQKI